MTNLNENQLRIATTLDGIVVVDAGPGTGKTHTIVQRYLNIIRNDVSPSDVLMLTFTNNAAAEMEGRVKSELALSSPDSDQNIHSSTFDSFCMRTVMESPETVSRFFKTKETLTRNARLIQNETLNIEYFRNVYTKFIRRYGRMYGNIPAIIGTSAEDLHKVIQRLMSIGIAPTHDGGWFGRDTGVLFGNRDKMISELLKNIDAVSEGYRNGWERLPPDNRTEMVTEEMIIKAADDPRELLLSFINGVYYEFIRSSISHNRLTFGLNALFAFIILYSNKNVRKLMSYRYVMVDEFQDTNELQFMMSLLILREPNLCVVGDWKQGIYGFRYASVENIIDFEERMNDMKRFLNKKEKRLIPGITEPKELSLTENYRSSQLVIDTAFRTLSCRTDSTEEIKDKYLSRITKLTAVRDTERTCAEIIRSETADDELTMILQKIEEYVSDERYRIIEYDKNGERTERQPGYGDIAVLCRGNGMCIRLKAAASEYGIPAHLQGDMRIMNTREGKLALAWLRYVNNRDDLRGPVTILTDAGYSLAELRNVFPKHGKRALPAELEEHRDRLRNKRRINDILTSIFEYHRLNNDITQSIISTISSAHDSSMLTISDVIGIIESDMKRKASYNVDALLDGRSVMIQTIHKSKGLEYPIVILCGLTRRKMPSSQKEKGLLSFDPLYGVRLKDDYVVIDGHHKIFGCWKWNIINNLHDFDRDEERRLFFVALSRAKQYITMTCYSRQESQFIKDISDSNIMDVVPAIKKKELGSDAAVAERPAVKDYERRKKRISLHDIMGEYEESGGGKGAEFGIRIHKEAQRIMSGMVPSGNTPETEYIKKIYDDLKNAKIFTEIDCTLPVNDIVIGGRIDMMAVLDDRVEVHDFKTDMNRVNEERYKIQLSVYAHAAASLGKPVRCVIDYVSQKISIDTEILNIDEIYAHMTVNQTIK
ncbi:MAG: ATP-dependent helicase [Methanomassiliicoccaceae archaeon]|jgi:superfamily I DNA/RNA helicase|nr:ATP-dependent helicase [Methanomassiliicoccaceae archaeon]